MNLPTPAPPQPTELARLQAGEPNRADRARRAAEHGYDLDPAKVGLVCQDLTVAQESAARLSALRGGTGCGSSPKPNVGA